jgi:acetylornithine deacetylase/succinyl-diaminopimelate desuccinylase-like protein
MSGTILFATLAFLILQITGAAQDVRLSNREEIKKDLVAVPCKRNERLSAAKSLFAQAGAQPSDIKLEEFNNGENLVVTKVGESSGKIVIGAHYDKVADGCGALDNWTGVVTIAHLFNSLKNTPLKKTVIFVAFDQEEKGLLGSRAMMEPVAKEQALEYCAMINIDTLGMAPASGRQHVEQEAGTVYGRRCQRNETEV